MGAAAKSATVGKAANRPGVTMFTRASVHWAERMVATSSCQGSWCSRLHWVSGNSRRRTAMISLARFFRVGRDFRGMGPILGYRRRARGNSLRVS